MKGSLHTDELMREVTASATGLRTERRISHVFVMDVPGYAETLFITDAAINIFPDLEAKRDIVQNAIDLWRGIGLGEPRVAILSAVETVTPKIPSTIDAAALCKMADRGQITGGLVDGPLAFDNAIDPEAARDQGDRLARRRACADPRRSRPRGRQHAGQEPDFLTHADAAGIVLGARVPIDPDLAGGQRCAPASPPARSRRSMPRARRNDRSGSWRPERMDAHPRHQRRLVEPEVRALRGGGRRDLERRVRGQLDGIGTRPRLRAGGAGGAVLVDRSWEPSAVADLPAAIAEVRSLLAGLSG